MNLHEAVLDAKAGRPRAIRCPAHNDKAPSLSVRPGTGGAVLLKCFRGCELADILGAGGLSWQDIFPPRENAPRGAAAVRPLSPPSPRDESARRAAEEAERARKRSTWPEFHPPTEAELRALARLRGIPHDGLRLAHRRGLLWFADFHEHRAWIVTDAARIAAQARRLDGENWGASGTPKAMTLPGSDGRHPVGAAGILPSHRALLLCEGGPDLLAALALVVAEGREIDAHAVAMLGAASSIADSALPSFKGRLVRIVEHDDEAGRTAGPRWARQLAGVAQKVDAIRFSGLTRADGAPVKDLNDALHLDADTFEGARFLWEVTP